MKCMKTSLMLIMLLVGLCMTACTSSHAEAGGDVQTPDRKNELLTISFRFQRGGIASSQYAIWIEDAKGTLVRTIYATSFTAEGGYEVRRESIPTWVAKARPGEMKDAQVNAVTGATPQNGTLTYVWDGTDDNGNRVAPGTYRFFVEGSLYWDSRVLFSGTVDWGGKDQPSIPLKEQRFNQSQTNADMITSLKASYHNSK